MKYIRSDNSKISFTTILEDREKASTFRHFKGKEYKIITIAKDSECLEDLVIYQAQYENKQCWSRKIDEFFSEVDKVKYPEVEQKYRFEIVE